MVIHLNQIKYHGSDKSDITDISCSVPDVVQSRGPVASITADLHDQAVGLDQSHLQHSSGEASLSEGPLHRRTQSPPEQPVMRRLFGTLWGTNEKDSFTFTHTHTHTYKHAEEVV